MRFGGKDIDFGFLGRIAVAFRSVDPVSQTPLLAIGGWIGAQSFGEFMGGIDLIMRLQGFRERYAAGQMPSVPEILVECVQSRATENADKVWALVGIGADLRTLRLPPGESKDDKKLFTAVTRHTLLSKEGWARYALLGMAGANNESERAVADWPSWVPDLAATPKLYPLGNAACPYNSGRGLPAGIEVEPGSFVLRVQGVLLGELEFVDKNNPLLCG